MNGFRAVADGSHVVAIFALFFKLFCTKSSAEGVSWKSQFLYLATYCARYLDLFSSFISVYNTTMKSFIILSSIVTVVTIPWILKDHYQKKFDTFWIELLILPVTVLALVLRHSVSSSDMILELCWTWSIYMEAVAIIPQFYMTWRGGHTDSLLITYLFGMFSYRGLYIGNWVYRYFNEEYYDFVAIGGGITETFVCLCGLIVTMAAYHRRGEATEPYYSVKVTQNVYTLPFITHPIQKGFGKDYKPLMTGTASNCDHLGSSDTQSLLRMLDHDEQSPYNHDLSVPIHQGSFLA